MPVIGSQTTMCIYEGSSISFLVQYDPSPSKIGYRNLLVKDKDKQNKFIKYNKKMDTAQTTDIPNP